MVGKARIKSTMKYMENKKSTSDTTENQPNKQKL